MEANVLAATYPDVFAGAASYSGIPAACLAGMPMSSDLSCPLGKKVSTYTAKQLGDLACGCDRGYNGTRPKTMIVHGTADTAVVISLLKAQLDQWSNVFDISFVKNDSNDPIANWKKIVYGDGTQLVGSSATRFRVAGIFPGSRATATLKFFF